MIKSAKIAVIVFSVVLTGCAGILGKPRVSNADLQIPVTPVEKNVVIQTVEFEVGGSSVVVEKMARKAGCVGGKGAGLMTPAGPVEVYRMACENGKNYLAKCELHQCKVM
jgi:hypothetical protein